MLKLAKELGQVLKQKGLFLVTAESCTGGQLAEIITTISGSSQWFERGFITYSNQSKLEMLGVKKRIIDTFGAVSKETVAAMTKGAIENSDAQVAIAVTGIAGPRGGSDAKPVGTVWFGFELPDGSIFTEYQFLIGNRLAIRKQAVTFALQKLLQLLAKNKG